MRKIAALLGMCLFAMPLFAQEQAVVLALSGGGVKGYAEIGVIKALEKHNIKIAGIVGTSIGSIVGSLYASGYSGSQLEKIALHSNFISLLNEGSDASLFLPSSGQTTPSGGLTPELYLDKDFKIIGPQGLFTGEKITDFLLEKTSKVQNSNFLQLPVPFVAVATNLETGEKVELTDGNLVSAVRASISLPGVFEPWNYDGQILVDGGLVSNLPVLTAKKFFPQYPVIAVDVTSSLEKKDQIRTFLDVFSQVTTIMTRQNVAKEVPHADVYLPINVDGLPVIGDVPIPQLIERGQQMVEAHLAEIQNVAVPFAPLSNQILCVDSKKEVKGIKVHGMLDQQNSLIEKQLSKKLLGKPFSQKILDQGVERIKARGDVYYVMTSLDYVSDGVIVNVNVTRHAPHRVGFSAYVSSAAHQYWLRLSQHSSDLFKQGDFLQTNLNLGKNWSITAQYFSSIVSDSPWSWSATVSRFSFEPWNDQLGKVMPLSWLRVSLDGTQKIQLAPHASLEIGLTASYVQTHNAFWKNYSQKQFNKFFLVPKLTFNYVWQNDWDDPRWGMSSEITLAWPIGLRSPVGQAVVHGNAKLGKNYLVEASLGYARGALDLQPYWGVFLGAKGELYSLMRNPLAGQQFAWARLSLGRLLQETPLGDINIQGFMGLGRVWAVDGSVIQTPWEVGILTTAPKKLLNAQAFLLYSSDKVWKFGLTLGQPDMSPYFPY